jgi:hypothetical protein
MSEIESSGPRPTERTTIEARQGVSGMGVRYVLVISTLIALAAMAVAFYLVVPLS